MGDERDASAGAARLVRRYHEGALEHPGGVAPVRYVVCGRTGRLVMALEPAMMHAEDLTLHVPDETQTVIQLLLTPMPLDGRDEACGRWEVYHPGPVGTPGGPLKRAKVRAWASCAIEAGKTPDEVYEPEALACPNVLRDAEEGLLRILNADAGTLARLCERAAGVAVASPVAVGVDQHGIDARARFGIVRVEFEPGVDTVQAARDAIEQMLGDGGQR